MDKNNSSVAVNLDVWRKAFDEAIRLKKSRLRQFASDKGLLVIQVPNQNDPVFVHPIFDDETQTQEIVIYPNRKALHSYERYLEYGETDWFNEKAERDCWKVLYTAKTSLSNEEYQLVRDLDYRFRGNNGWVAFRKEAAGYADSFPFNAEELAQLIVVLEQLYQLVEAEDGKVAVPAFDQGMTICRYPTLDAGSWQQSQCRIADQIPALSLFSVSLQDEAFIQQLLNKSKTKYAIELDLNYFLEPEAAENGANYYPQVLVMVNNQSGEIEEEYSIDLTRPAKIEEQVVNQLIDYILAHGRPRRIYVRSMALNVALQSTCQQLNIPLRQREVLEKIDPQWIEILEAL